MRLDERRDDAEPHAGSAAVAPGREERLEDAGAVARRNAVAVVGRGDRDDLAGRRADSDKVLGAVPGRIVDQVGEHDRSIFRRHAEPHVGAVADR